LTDFGLDIGQYKPSGDDGRTDVGDDTCGFGIADTAVETCVAVDFGDQSDKINSVDRMLEADTCTDSVVHILALYVAFHRYNRESLEDTVFVELGGFQSLLIQSHRQFQLVVFDLAIGYLKYYLVLMVALLLAAVVDAVAGVIVAADPVVDE